MTSSRDDAAVFTGIFERHRHAVHAYFLGRVADPELARDLLQETFLRVWRRLSDADAERVRQAIVPEVPTLSATWWSEFNSRISEAVTRATAVPVPGFAALP